MFQKWFRSKFEAWREGKYGVDSSQAAFARYLDINVQSVSEYLEGESTPKHIQTVEKLFRAYGKEIYPLLGIELTEEEQVISYIRQLNPAEKENLIKEIKARPDYELFDLGPDNNDLPPA